MVAPYGYHQGMAAYLCIHHVLRHGDYRNRAIMPDEEFDFGRKEVHHLWGITEHTISLHHLRFRCIMFDSSPGEPNVNPLIYVRVLSSNPVTLKTLDAKSADNTCLLNKDSGDVLLNHDDVLELTPTVSLLFQSTMRDDDLDKPFNRACQVDITRFAHQYQVTNRILGAGGNASVFLAFHGQIRRQLACKIVPIPIKARHTSPEKQHGKRDRLAREYNLLKDLDHPNIIRLEKVICSSDNIYIFQELITGGDLLSYLGMKKALSEPQATVIVRQILEAVDYLHRHLISHRDIKPENILMTSWADGARVVLTDFGQARAISHSRGKSGNAAVSRMQTFVGTHGYAAPEIYRHHHGDTVSERGYSQAVDMWSVGCITATMLMNGLIFEGEELHYAATDDNESSPLDHHLLWSLDIMDEDDNWRAVGRKAKSFIRGCLVVDVGRRLTAAQALKHDWFTNRHYATELEAAYKHAISKWKPRGQSDDLIEDLDTINSAVDVRRSQEVDSMAQETRSAYFMQLDSHAPPSLSIEAMEALKAKEADMRSHPTFCASSFRT